MFFAPASEKVGSIKGWPGATIPPGWGDCDGAAISRTTYAALFAEIGTTYGVGDGSTTFNKPDFRGRSLIGAGTGSGLTARSRGQSGGAEGHALTESENGVHTHAYRGSSVGGGGGDFINQSSNNAPNSTSEASSPADSGSGSVHNNMSPFGVAFYIIKIE